MFDPRRTGWSLTALVAVAVLAGGCSMSPDKPLPGAESAPPPPAAVAPPILFQDPIATADGPITGALADADKAIHVYKGIPFAAPPVGPLRWKPPQPVTPWTAPRACTAFGRRCVQPEALLGKDNSPQSEDCLYLNLWTPAKTSGDNLPVMVWIHGGGYTTGSGSTPLYDGVHLAEHGVILVSFNYRLGPFGYFAHPLLSKESPHDVSGNYGSLDQIAALQWVHKNIAAFGGDPGCVTIFGESAGAASVTRLMVSPLAKGLFQRAIAESGGPFGRNRHLKDTANGQPSMESVGVDIAKKLGCADAPDVLAALRAVPADNLLAAADPQQGLFGKGIHWGPVVDGYFLPADPGQMWLDGKQAPVPFMTGSNADEGTIFLRQLPIHTVLGYRLALRAYMKTDFEAVLKLYPVHTDNDVRHQLAQVVGLTSFEVPAREMVRCQEQLKAPRYLYRFTRVPNIGGVTSYGAFHSAELFYVFGNFIRPVKVEPGDTALSQAIMTYWTHFAKFGNPNPPDADVAGVGPGPGPELPAWPAYSAQDDRCLELGDKIEPLAGLDKAACDLGHERLIRLMKTDHPEDDPGEEAEPGATPAAPTNTTDTHDTHAPTPKP
ncbi:MAG: carboxylesterase/lipase family protein [Planctomycetota bacterium]